MSASRAASARLQGDIGLFQYLALGFGTVIGSAWVILLGNWLGEAGPGGAVLGFLCGGVVVVAVGACYAELTARLPEAGSEFIYAHRVYGRGAAFTVGWFLVLYLVSVTVFEALALAWIAEIFVPTWKSATLYAAFGKSITSETLLTGIGAALVIFALNVRGARVAVATHSFLTYGFFAVVLVILAALLINGSTAHLLPLFASTNGKPWWLGCGAIFAFCAYGLNGFQAIPQAIEERSGAISLRSIGFVVIGSIVAAAVFYSVVVIAGSAIVPWRELVPASLPMATAAAALPHGQFFVTLLLLATAVSLFKAWNGVYMMTVRLLVAMARAGYVPARLGHVSARLGSPVAALLLVSALNIAGIFLGKGAIEPITDMAAMVLTLTYVMCCATVLKLRRTDSAAAFLVPGGRYTIWLGLIGASLMAATAFLAPLWQQGGVPLEWQLLGAWSAIGAAVWFYYMRTAAALNRP